MIGKYKVVTLCGSTKFKNTFIQIQKELTLKGYIVISVGLFVHSDNNITITKQEKEMLNDIHKRKIDMADEIFVIDVDGYIGKSTRSEIDYAIANHKIVRFYSNPNMIIDECGGIHEEGLGWNPDDEFCGECSNTTCKNCKVYRNKNKIFPVQSFYYDTNSFQKPDKMTFEKNPDGTYKVYIEGILVKDNKKNTVYKANAEIPKANIPFANIGIPIPFIINEIMANKKDELFTLEVLEDETV